MPFTVNAKNLHYVTTQKKDNYSIFWDLCIEKHNYKLSSNKKLYYSLKHTNIVHTTITTKYRYDNILTPDT